MLSTDELLLSECLVTIMYLVYLAITVIMLLVTGITPTATLLTHCTELVDCHALSVLCWCHGTGSDWVPIGGEYLMYLLMLRTDSECSEQESSSRWTCSQGTQRINSFSLKIRTLQKLKLLIQLLPSPLRAKIRRSPRESTKLLPRKCWRYFPLHTHSLFSHLLQAPKSQNEIGGKDRICCVELLMSIQRCWCSWWKE